MCLPQVLASTEPSAKSETHPYLFESKHRLNLSLHRDDTEDGDAIALLPGYTLALGPTFRFNITASLRREGQEQGLGDSLFVFQYDPSRKLTASPWIPDTLGLRAIIRAPTGDTEKGFSADSWLVNLGAGWAFNTRRNFWLFPAGYYENTFSEKDQVMPDEEIGISVNFIWLFDNGIWVGYKPTLARNLKQDEWADYHSFILGKVFRNRFGLSLAYGRRNRLDNTALEEDYTALFNFYYLYGRVR